jgi:uncharacterized protein YodC (DUF2158 family)
MDRFRVGRKLKRTIYRQVGAKPSDDDQFWGIVDTPEQARVITAALERFFEEWKQPAIGDLWEAKTKGAPNLSVSDARRDGKYVCRKLDDSGYTIKSAEDLNIEYVYGVPAR